MLLGGLKTCFLLEDEISDSGIFVFGPKTARKPSARLLPEAPQRRGLGREVHT